MKLKDTVRKYADLSPARFHMPGHKGTIDPYDITELSSTDNLHAPTGPIADLQKRCAKIYDADEAFLLVNGSSAGVCAMLCALALRLGRKPRVLVGRDCHRSFISGSFFADADVCGVYPDIGFLGIVTADSIEFTLGQLFPSPDAVFITSPNYYGMCADTEGIYALAKKHGAYLFVDCAHGAHFPFSDELPPVPKADAFCVSTHKTLCALNQTGLLLSTSELAPYMKNALFMLQTTSPSYPLMLSIENSMECDWSVHMQRIKNVRKKLSALGIKTAEKPCSAKYADLTRLCILCDNMTRTGYELGDYLETQGIYTEMNDLYCSVLITTPEDKDEWYEKLICALEKIKGKCSDTVPIKAQPHFTSCNYTDIRSAMLAKSELVPYKSAQGRISTQAVGIYPPGISYVMPGEVITRDIIRMLERYLSTGGSMFGDTDGKIAVMR